MESSAEWAKFELGSAELGDARLTARAVKMAETMANRPGGMITEVFEHASEREAAFRFVENERVETAALVKCCARAAAERCAELTMVYVPIDSTTLRVVDRARRKGFGPIGNFKSCSRGLNVMSAIAVSPEANTPLGLCAQVWWNRPLQGPTVKSYKHDKRPLNERQSYHWLTALRSVKELFVEEASNTTPWFQLDRGGDYREVLKLAVDEQLLLTVRASSNRRLDTSEPLYLFRALALQPILGTFEALVPARNKAPARVATLSIRAQKFPFRLQSSKGRCERVITLGAVYVREVEPPKGIEPIDWKLLTTHSIDSFDDAYHVAQAYKARWTIEEFHRAWKSGVCHVEQSQLRTPQNFQRWATMLAPVALRIERLKKLSRESPELPATVELSLFEIDAAYLLRRPKTIYKQGEIPSLGEVVRWIADLGGYTGKSSGGPPGSKVLQRGMLIVLAAAKALEADHMRRSAKAPKRKVAKM